MTLSQKPNLLIPGHLRPPARFQRYPLRRCDLVTIIMAVIVRVRVFLSIRRGTLLVSRRNTTRTAAGQEAQRRANKQDDDGGAAVLTGIDYPMNTVSHSQGGEDACGECYQGADERHDESPSSV
jgi:hypothetical protein